MHFTHDLMRDPEPLRRVLSRVRPGGRIVASGLKWTPWPLRNLLVLGAALHSVTTLAGLDAPWRSLEPWLGEPELETMFGGMVYLARWRLPG
jgi:hypothetical protein